MLNIIKKNRTEQNRTEHILLRNLYKQVSRYKHMKNKIKLNLLRIPVESK